MGLTIVTYLIMITVAVIITINEDYDIVAQSRDTSSRAQAVILTFGSVKQAAASRLLQQGHSEPSPSWGSWRQTDAMDKPQAGVWVNSP